MNWTEINNEIENLNTVNQLDLTDIYRTFHQTTKNRHSSQAHTEHLLGYIICKATK